MNTPKFLDDPISVDAHLSNNRLYPKTVTWRNQEFVVTTVGRQWAEEGETHVLIELHEGSRMQIKFLGNLNWRLCRYWPSVFTV